MIFKADLAQAVIEGRKTVTRRPAKGVCRYKVGRSYAVQPGRGKKAIGRVRVLEITREELGVLHRPEAECEGFEDGAEFTEAWENIYGTYDPTELVDVIVFEVEREGER